MKWWIVLLACALTGQARADLLDTRLAGFARETHRKAEFTETLTASYLNQPVISRGKLEYQAPDHLVKIIATPEPVRYSIKQNMLTVQRGKDVQQINLDRQPLLGMGINALRDLLRGDRRDLEARFWTSYSTQDSDPDHWKLLLIPRDQALLQRVSRVVMRGIRNQLQEVKMEYTNGDLLVTRITGND